MLFHFMLIKYHLLLKELKIPEEFKSILRKYPKFWNANSRINSFKELYIENYSEENINIGILCVLANVKIANFDELLKKVLTENNLDENKYLIEFDEDGNFKCILESL